ncbi:hypothetical protein C8J57DRAFT_1672038 [Mycena rebaudengoi]|nr:hypothetical protein C8J57DRAFT_1672038 [Mycena rebaudengoi]
MIELSAIEVIHASIHILHLLLVRVRGRPADVGHERRDDTPAHAHPRKPPVLFVLRCRIPILPASLIGVSPPPIMGSVTPPMISPGSKFPSNSALRAHLVKNNDAARDCARLSVFGYGCGGGRGLGHGLAGVERSYDDDAGVYRPTTTGTRLIILLKSGS